MIGIRVIVQRAAAGHLEIVHARLGRREKGPKMTATAAIAQYIVAVHDGSKALPLTLDLSGRLLKRRIRSRLPALLLSAYSVRQAEERYHRPAQGCWKHHR
jgi:hypothetical protein